MRTIGNILWVMLCGVWTSLGWLFWAVVLGITIVGLPFARQCLKLARFTLWPFGYEAVPSPTAARFGVLGNLLWFIPGVVIAFGYAVSGVMLCASIIGIPFGIQAFKFIGLAISPFGKQIVNSNRYQRELRAAYDQPF